MSNMKKENSFVRTIAINKILSMKARKKIIQGGSSALYSPDRN